MIFDPLISEIAALPLTMLVRPADAQNDDTQTACWCPFSKEEGDGANTPHFIIYKNERGGLYKDPVSRWMCTRTKRQGYGAIELYAAIHNLGFWSEHKGCASSITVEGENLRKVCRELAVKCGYSEDEIAKRWPSILHRDYRGVSDRPLTSFDFQPKTDFTPQELTALGCSVWVDSSNKAHFGFDTDRLDSKWHFEPYFIQQDFSIYSLTECTLPAVNRNGEPVSEKIYGTPFNPLFLAYVDAEDERCGCVFRPAMDVPPIVFSNDEEVKPSKVSRWLSGDRVFTFAVEHRTTESTAVRRAIDTLDPDEIVTETKQVWAEGEDKDGVPNGRWQLTEEPIEDKDIKAQGVIYCTTPQDAVATYYHLKALRYTFPKTQQKWFHVAFSYGKVDFSPVHYNKLSRFAERVYTLFPNDNRSVLAARAIGRRYRDILRASLPPNMSDRLYLHTPRVFARPVRTVRDFFLAYRMPKEESFLYDDDLDRRFVACITSALSSCPMEKKQKRDTRGRVKEDYYVIDPATVWEFVAAEGYVRDVDMESTDKIGRFVHISGPFADELDAPSMVQRVQECLTEYARQNNSDPEDYRLMVQAISRDNREVNEKTIGSLPAVQVNYKDGYGPDVDYFYFQNGALRITKDDITLVPYSQIDFNIDRGEVMPWPFYMPQSQPFVIEENPVYQDRKKAIEAKREQKDDNGQPLYTLQQLASESTELALWAQSHRWVVDWKGKQDKDMCPSLRVLRGFANEDWKTEQDLLHSGKTFSSEEQLELDGRMANLVFCLGRVLWRYRESKSNCIPYLVENTVSSNGRAEGGSGKSTFVKMFAGSCCYILDIDGKNIEPSRDLSFSLSRYVHRHHRVVHWEDVNQNFSIKSLYNYATGSFVTQKKFVDPQEIKLSEGPGHVVSSNYPLSDMDDSTMRRVCLGGFSHRFSGENILKNKAARYISDVMPDFNPVSLDRMSNRTRSQLIMICAIAVQFVMRFDEKVDAQKKYMEQRTLTQSLGESFLRFARVFFGQEYVYGVPIDLDSMLEEYKADYAEASKNKNDSFSTKAFKRRVMDYCETCGITMNPPQMFRKTKNGQPSKAEQTNYFAHQAWCTRRYFEGREWEGDTTIQPKQVRELVRTEHAVYFYRTKDKQPADYDELMATYTEFLKQPDPAPILDDKGNVVALTEEERQRWRDFKDRRQGKYSGGGGTVTTTTPAPPAVDESDLPF